LPLRLNSFISSSQELSQLSGKVRQLHALQALYEKVTPPSLLRSSHVIQIEQNTLTLAADNSAIAAKLRQMIPELIQQFKLLNCEVTGIQVRVQVTLPPPSSLRHTASVSAHAKKELNQLAGTLDDSPLKHALQRLINSKKSKQ
jgi:hypothetical protein